MPSATYDCVEALACGRVFGQSLGLTPEAQNSPVLVRVMTEDSMLTLWSTKLPCMVCVPEWVECTSIKSMH